MGHKDILKSLEHFTQSLWRDIWVKVFKNGPGKICGRQPWKNLKWYGLPKFVSDFMSNLILDIQIIMFHKLVWRHQNGLKVTSTIDLFSPKLNSRKRTQHIPQSHCTKDINDVVLVFLLLTLNIFHTFSLCFYSWLWTSKCLLGQSKMLDVLEFSNNI